MYKKIIILSTISFAILGCNNTPQQPQVKKTPKDINATTTSTMINAGTVYAEQKDYYLKSCQNGDGQGCRNMATLYLKGLGVKKDANKAFEYVKRGCELNNASSCTKLGNIYDDNKMYQKSAEAYMKGCQLNSGVSCNNIGNMYMHGQGVVKNYALSENFLNKALQLGYNAYNNLGFLYYKKGDDAKAKEYYIKGCDLKGTVACNNLAMLYSDHKNYFKAYNTFIKSCNLGNAKGCNGASMILYNKQVSIPNPQQMMFKLDSNSCEMNNAIGCANLAYDYKKGIGVASDIKKAKVYYKKSCKLGNSNSCKQL